MDDSATTNSDPPPPTPPQTQSKPSSTRRRRNSIATSVVVPTKLSFTAAATTTKPLQSFNTFPTHQNGTVSAPPPLDYDELLSLKCSPPQTYTSLKDILPVSASNAAVSSPTAASAAAVSSGYEISIRNRLVKQAAWAYLQPMSSSPGSSGPHFLHRLWLSFLSFFKRHVVPAFTHLLHQVLRACDCR
ncbi:hypothetical protein SO802_030876 [Lithocarpus litseifolius]|uniref:Uncharacterized protein n=1 Tax=Lithocarpus litseifolius TaxID=425828 RepID=A0AAW2BIT8_9ROSI